MFPCPVFCRQMDFTQTKSEQVILIERQCDLDTGIIYIAALMK
jgi:hypothetical protein